MPTVGETLTLPGGTPPESARVDVTLVGTAGVPVVGYMTGATITGKRQATVNGSGAWSLDLPANTDISPSGTAWAVDVNAGGHRSRRYIIVPDSEGPHDVDDLLTDPPAAIASSALEALAAQVQDLGERVADLEQHAVTLTPED